MERTRFLQEQAINSAMYYILEKSDTGAWGTTGIIGYLYNLLYKIFAFIYTSTRITLHIMLVTKNP